MFPEKYRKAGGPAELDHEVGPCLGPVKSAGRAEQYGTYNDQPGHEPYDQLCNKSFIRHTVDSSRRIFHFYHRGDLFSMSSSLGLGDIHILNTLECPIFRLKVHFLAPELSV